MSIISQVTEFCIHCEKHIRTFRHMVVINEVSFPLCSKCFPKYNQAMLEMKGLACAGCFRSFLNAQERLICNQCLDAITRNMPPWISNLHKVKEIRNG